MPIPGQIREASRADDSVSMGHSTISRFNKALRAFVAGGDGAGAEDSLPAKDDVDGGESARS